MRYKRLGRTGLNVSVISFGCIPIIKVGEKQAIRAIQRALDLGINFIDTARIYGDAERKVGKAIKGRRDECYIATKTEARDAKTAAKDIDISLAELDIDKIDLYQLHTVSDRETYEQVMAPDGALAALKRAQTEGKIAHIGVSSHRDLATMKALIRSDEFETLMVVYNQLDEEGTGAEIMPLAKEHDMGVIVMKGLSGGRLVTPRPEGKYLPGLDPIVTGSLRFILSNSDVTTVAVGMKTAREVEENIAIGDLTEPISEDEIRTLIECTGGLGGEFRYGRFCLSCGYCQPCPQGIDIPEVFRAFMIYKNYPDNLKPMGLDIYRRLEVGPDECVECGECEEKCPAKLPIIERLKEVVKVFDVAAQ